MAVSCESGVVYVDETLMHEELRTELVRIVYVINHLAWFWSHRLPLARGVRERGWDVVVAAPGAANDTSLCLHGFRGADIASSGRRRPLITLLRGIWQIKRLIERERPTILHAITLKASVPAVLAARLVGNTTVIVTIAGLGYLFCSKDLKAQWMRRALIPILAYALTQENVWIIFQNRDDWRTLEEYGAMLPQRSIVIGGSGVVLSDFSPAYQAVKGPAVVLMASRMVREKGIAVFAQAARLVKSRGYQAQFILAGGLDETNPAALSSAEMQAIVANGDVEWLGHVVNLSNLYSRCALFVYPSYYGEGVPKVLLEAAAAGLPIVTTDHRGCRDVVADHVNGFLVPVQDPGATADAIIRLLSDAELRAIMGRQSRERASREFDVEIIIERTISFYRQALTAV
jgi:glycosyltransferase involved in cell wall biosynthesis